MTLLMNKCFWRFIFAAGAAVILAGCGNKETRQALDKALALENQKDPQYEDANTVLLDALRAREASIRAGADNPSDQAAADALAKKVQSDSEILKLERAQIPLYLHLDRADLALAVYTDILKGSPNDTVVYDALHDKDPLIRTGAIRILGSAAKPDSIDALIAATGDSDKEVRRAAVAALGSIKDPKTIAPLIAALKDSYWFTRSEAASDLGQKLDPSAIKALIDTVADSDKTVEGSAESALLFLSGPNGATGISKDDFASHLNDPNPKILLISAVCLAIQKDSRAVPVLEKLLSSPDLTTRLDAVRALGESGDPSVIPTLRQTLKDPDNNMRGWSIIGLGILKDQGSLADLRAIAGNANEPASIRGAATKAADNIAGTTAATAPPATAPSP
jgi:HEAT repeat protein